MWDLICIRSLRKLIKTNKTFPNIFQKSSNLRKFLPMFIITNSPHRAQYIFMELEYIINTSVFITHVLYVYVIPYDFGKRFQKIEYYRNKTEKNKVLVELLTNFIITTVKRYFELTIDKDWCIRKPLKILIQFNSSTVLCFISLT